MLCYQYFRDIGQDKVCFREHIDRQTSQWMSLNICLLSWEKGRTIKISQCCVPALSYSVWQNSCSSGKLSSVMWYSNVYTEPCQAGVDCLPIWDTADNIWFLVIDFPEILSSVALSINENVYNGLIFEI